jgi:hypothetical protein
LHSLASRRKRLLSRLHELPRCSVARARIRARCCCGQARAAERGAPGRRSRGPDTSSRAAPHAGRVAAVVAKAMLGARPVLAPPFCRHGARARPVSCGVGAKHPAKKTYERRPHAPPARPPGPPPRSGHPASAPPRFRRSRRGALRPGRALRSLRSLRLRAGMHARPGCPPRGSCKGFRADRSAEDLSCRVGGNRADRRTTARTKAKARPRPRPRPTTADTCALHPPTDALDAEGKRCGENRSGESGGFLCSSAQHRRLLCRRTAGPCFGLNCCRLQASRRSRWVGYAADPATHPDNGSGSDHPPF